MRLKHFKCPSPRHFTICVALMVATCASQGCADSDAVPVSSREISPDEVKIEGLTGKAAKAATRAAIEPDGRPRGARRARTDSPS